MPNHSRLGCHGNIISYFGAPGNSALGHNQGVLANFYVVGDLHEIINFGPLPNQGAPKPRPINAAVSPDFYIILEFDNANLGNFLMAPLHELETIPI